MPDRPFSPFLFRLYASDLSEAIYDLSREQHQMSITGFEPGAIQAKLEEFRQKAADRQKNGLSRLDAAHAQAVAKVDAAIDGVIAKIDKEADAAIAEFAPVTNGGPTLDSIEPPQPGYPTYP